MKLIVVILLCPCLLAGCAGTMNERAAQSCPAEISAPTLDAGDTWRWRDDKGVNRYRRYALKTGEGLLEMEGAATGAKLFYDNTHTLRKVYRDGQWVTGESVDFPDLGKIALDFPLRPGKSWTHTAHARSSGGGLILTYRSTYTVRGCEQARVPAGSFQAVVIEEEQSIVGETVYGSRTWWYAPDVKFFVKLTHGHASHPGFWTSQSDWTLTSYQIAPTVSTTPKAGSPAPPATPSSSPAKPTDPDLESRLRTLKELRERNLITEEQYQSSVKELLQKLTH
jgi:hypothetical protein